MDHTAVTYFPLIVLHKLSAASFDRVWIIY